MDVEEKNDTEEHQNWVKSATTRQHGEQEIPRRVRFFLPGGPEGFRRAHALNDKRRIESEDVLRVCVRAAVNPL